MTVQEKLKELGFTDVKSFQKAKGLIVDGIVGPKTMSALFPISSTPFYPRDVISLQRIEQMHPKLRAELRAIYEEVYKALTGKAFFRISQGLRTIAEQDSLYAQGRTRPGSIVTNARGGSSYHNYGLAVDFVLVVNGKDASWDMVKDFDDDQKADWVEVVEIFKKYGWAWGGNWKSMKDYPHFDKPFGYTINDLKIKYNKKDFIKGTDYLNI